MNWLMGFMAPPQLPQSSGPEFGKTPFQALGGKPPCAASSRRLGQAARKRQMLQNLLVVLIRFDGDGHMKVTLL